MHTREVLRRVGNRVRIAVNGRGFETNRVEACASVYQRNQNALRKPTKAVNGTKRQTAEYAKYAEGEYGADAHAPSIARLHAVQLSKSRNLRSHTDYVYSVRLGCKRKIASGWFGSRTSW